MVCGLYFLRFGYFGFARVFLFLLGWVVSACFGCLLFLVCLVREVWFEVGFLVGILGVRLCLVGFALAFWIFV